MARKAGTKNKTKPKQLSEIDRMWLEFKRTDNPNLRAQLIEHYVAQKLVQNVAKAVFAKIPNYAGVQLDDLVSEGTIGLMSAVEGFDVDRSIKFETYAPLRIRGQMIDYLRTLDPVPRLVRVKQKRAQKLIDGGMPEAEAQAAVKLTEQDQQLLRMQHESFERILPRSHDDNPQTLLSACGPLVPHEGKRTAQRSERFEQLTRGLLFEEKLILWLYYHTQVTMREIGQLLHLSESRVSQKHAQLLEYLRINRTDDDRMKGLFQP